MSKAREILLGFEVGESGAEVSIPIKHMAITGQSQEAGKTTALEALISRSGLRAVTFITKRGESSFVGARRIDPYFREQADWQFVASILEASRGEKLKFERAWIIRASRGAKTLADVQANVQKAMEKAKGMSADVYLTLDAYLDVVVPEIAKVEWATGVDLRGGVNAVDLTDLSIEMQHLVIRSTISWVLNREENTVVVVPEAWKYIPQGRGTPVKLAAEAFIRQAAAMGNYLWLDSQDLGGIDKQILRSVPVWILGVQREINEIKRTLDNIPAGFKKPKPADIATLELGQFYACWGKHSIKTYVQPAWLDTELAVAHAKGVLLIENVLQHVPLPDLTQELVNRRATPPPPYLIIEPKQVDQLVRRAVDRVEALRTKPESPPDMSYDEKLANLERENERFQRELSAALDTIRDLTTPPPGVDPAAPTPTSGTVQTGPVNIHAIEREVLITFSQETRSFETTGVRGRIMFTLVHELKQPSREKEIITAMAERGWNHIRQTVAPELSKLVKAGDLIRNDEDSTFRLPGKIKLTIDGKKV